MWTERLETWGLRLGAGITGRSPRTGIRSLAAVSVFGVAFSTFLLPFPAHAAPPSNNACLNARVIELGENAFTNIDATTDGPAVPCAGSVSKDVWFRFDSTFTGLMTVSTCGDADFDTVIAVYNGCGCGSFTLLGCNDENNNCLNHTSQVAVNVVAGNCYLIRVMSFTTTAAGTGVLTLFCPAGSAACANLTREGTDSGDQLGKSVAGAAKVNGDSFQDILIGAPLNDTGGDKIGRAYALRGDNFAALWTFTGTLAGEQLGLNVASGDVNNDGRSDLILGSPKSSAAFMKAGRVTVYSGFNGSELWHQDGFNLKDQFGTAVASAGDVNADGFVDVIVGAPFFNGGTGGVNTDSGRAYVLDGENGNVLFYINGSNLGDRFGSAVAGIGDLNNDGKDDIAVGAPGVDLIHTDAGRVSIYSGATHTVLQRIDGDAAGDQFGTSIAGKRFSSGGVVYDMVAIGAPFNDAGGSNAGRVKVYLRNITTPAANPCTKLVCLKYTMNGGNAGDNFGAAVAIGNVVGNSVMDILVGAPLADFAGSSSGAMYLFDGNNGAQAARLVGEGAGDQFGTSIANAGDANNDGLNDLLAGAPYNDANGSNSGRAYLFYANTPATPPSSPGGGGAALLTSAIAPVFGQIPGEALTTIIGRDPQVIFAAGADLNADDVVDASDLSLVLSLWGPCPSAIDCFADLNGNGAVDMDDLVAVLEAWRR